MPSSSAKQVRTMAAAAHDPKFAKKMGIPQSVAKDFNKADTGKKIRRSESLIGHKKKKRAPASIMYDTTD